MDLFVVVVSKYVRILHGYGIYLCGKETARRANCVCEKARM